MRPYTTVANYCSAPLSPRFRQAIPSKAIFYKAIDVTFAPSGCFDEALGQGLTAAHVLAAELYARAIVCNPQKLRRLRIECCIVDESKRHFDGQVPESMRASIATGARSRINTG
jgi:hypothetical protein